MEKHTFNIQLAAESNLGLHRINNEDSFLVCRPDSDSVLVCVADGIGSHSDGKLASSICCRDLLECAMAHKGEFKDPENFLKQIFSQINTKLFERNYREKRPRPMGCTAVSALFTEELITVLNVGDSRFYEYFADREKPFQQITVDHHLDEERLEQLAKEHQVDKEALRRRVLLHSLGTRQQVETDIFTVIPKPGARYLLCTDGLSGRVPEERILKIIANEKLSCRELTSALIREALVCGGRDNITVVTAIIPGESDGIA